jgi:hypothetical protein
LGRLIKKKESKKMKKITAMVLTALLVLSLSISLPGGMLIANAASVTENGIVFETNTGTITDYIGSASTLVIPSTIGGFAVTSIGTWAFGYGFSLTSVTIPGGVTSIGDWAFYNCNSLTSVTIPSGVTSIGDSAFSQCQTLTSITIPNGVTSLGDDAFSGSPLTSITIPDSVTSIGNNAFSYSSLTSVTIPANVTSIGVSPFVCGSLISINVDAANLNYSSANGILYNKNKTVLVEYPSGKSGSVTIPGSVTSIGEAAFSGCSSLTGITIPNSVTSIGEKAFSSCYLLTSIIIPNSVTSIGDSAFAMCDSLTSIIIPDGVTSIGDSVFMGCFSLTRVTIPNSVTSIGDGAFERCSSLTRVTIPNSVTSIGNRAFEMCFSLTSIIIPSSVISIGSGAFEMCFSLTIYGYEGSYAQTYAAADEWSPITFSTDLPNISECVMEYNIDPTYTVTIPTSMTIGESGGTIEIKSSDINTLPNETVYVKISNGIDADGIISLTNQSDSITSTLSNSEGAINTNTVVASFEGLITNETIGGKLNLSRPADTSNKRGGIYTGTLTFTVAMGLL